MSIGIIRYPGSNCDNDALQFFENSFYIPHTETTLPKNVKLIVIPGGFAFGDRIYEKATGKYIISPGTMAIECPVSNVIMEAKEKNIPILGICNGFQILVKMGLLPGRLIQNNNHKFTCKKVECEFQGIKEELWIANGYGQYVNESISKSFINYTSSVREIGGLVAGVSKGNIFGLMPHPERGCSPEFKEALLKLLFRDQTRVENSIQDLLHSEHISYKSTKKHLAKLHTNEPWVVQGPGENAGIVDIGDGYCIAIRIESHNHPTFIDPFEGAATGVGGILRDIMAMGARPIGILDFLRFGMDNHSNELLEGAINGISYYGNCFGVANLGGDLWRHTLFNKNPLVNVACLGIVKKENIIYGNVGEEGDLMIYVGSKTGREGVGGAAMASNTFSSDTELDKSTVQKSDPFLERLLMEACMEISENKLAVGMQDLGAGGLLCATFEVVKRGNEKFNKNYGCEVDLSKVPLKHNDLTDYEILVSESQERMLIVANEKNKQNIFDIFEKWNLEYAVIGVVNNSGMYNVTNNKYVFQKSMLDFDKVDSVDWPLVINPYVELGAIKQKRMDLWKVYDSSIGNRTIKGPDKQGSYSLLNIPENGKQICLSWGETFDECYRTQIKLEHYPLAIVNCLNYGHPKECMGQISTFLEELTLKCVSYNIPIIGGNVSLYNKTDSNNIPPTPVLVMIGINRI